MKCSCCGLELEPGSRFCGACGARVPETVPVDEPVSEALAQPQPMEGAGTEPLVQDIPVAPTVPPEDEPVGEPPVTGILSEQEFYSRYMPKKGKYLVMALMILSFITASLSFVLLLLGNPTELLDLAVYLTAGYLLLKQKNWRVALGVTVYSGVLTVLMLIIGGGIMGILGLAVGIFATIELKKHSDNYRHYKQSCQGPDTDDAQNI